LWAYCSLTWLSPGCCCTLRQATWSQGGTCMTPDSQPAACAPTSTAAASIQGSQMLQSTFTAVEALIPSLLLLQQH
jgi:hypothetical protein